MIRVRLVDSTNEILFQKYQGYIGTLVFVGGSAWIMDVERLKTGEGYGGFHTSLILGYELVSQTLIVFQTINSEYTFEAIEGIFENDEPLLEAMIEDNKRAYGSDTVTLEPCRV